MGNKYKQNQEGLETVNKESIVLPYFLKEPNTLITKEELMSLTGLNERAVRAEIEWIANFYPIYATAGKKGYALLLIDDTTSIDDLRSANELAYSQVCELQHRIDSLKARMKPLIALMNITAVKLQAKTQGDK